VLTDVKAAIVDRALLLCEMDSYPSRAVSLLRMSLQSEAILRAWVTCLGVREKQEHLAHLICELHARLRRAGLVADHEFTLPLSQSELAEVLGAAVVHTNRVLQRLRRAGLITARNKHLHVLQPPALRKMGEFDGTYLGLEDEGHGQYEDEGPTSASEY
jgi:CRP-like cAMP-binding protein